MHKIYRFKINEYKTKHMARSRPEQKDRIGQYMTIQFKFERVHEFECSTITFDNNMAK